MIAGNDQNPLQDLLPEFLEEAQELLAMLEAALLQVEQALADRRPPEPETIQRLFRVTHTLRSASGFIGLAAVERTATAMEDLFNFMRNGDLSPDKTLTAAAFETLDHIKKILAGQTPGTDDEEGERLAASLEAATSARIADRTRESAARVVSPGDLLHGLPFRISAYAIERKTRKGNFFIVTTMLDGSLDERRKISMEASSALGSMGEIIDTVTLTGDPDTPDRTHFLYHTLIGEKALRETLSSLPTEVDISKVDRTQLAKAATDLPAEPAPRSERRAAPARKKPDGPDAPPEKAATEQQPESAAASPWDDCADFVTFFIEQELYAVPIFLVHDIKETMPFSRLPNQPPHLLGVINLRGNVLPLFDLRRLIGMPPRPFDRKTVIIILDIAGKKTGCVVDAISDVVTLEPEDKQAKPLLGRRTAAEYVRFIGKDQRTGAFLIVLDIERMLSR